jgi:molecular chaperone GrpE
MPKKATKTPETDYQALYQRALADLENQRKRFDDERKIIGKFGIGDLVLELLPVLDNFTRATEHVPAEQKDNPWTTGILYIRKQFMDVLEARGVTEVIPQVGQPFDPTEQEAIGIVYNTELPDQSVAQLQHVGYRLHERVIRPAQVTVITHETK